MGCSGLLNMAHNFWKLPYEPWPKLPHWGIISALDAPERPGLGRPAPARPRRRGGVVGLEADLS